MKKENKNKKEYPKMTEEIEEYCWYLLENGEWSKLWNYLKELGFKEEDIEFMLEVWRDGKSLYPY